jgi:glycosyltransferase involved in cell wall biosynthesis
MERRGKGHRRETVSGTPTMHVLYAHPSFPAQFGHIARHMVNKLGRRATFVSRTPGGVEDGIEKIQYRPSSSHARQGHYCARTFERTIRHCDAVYRALKRRPDVKPDLIVGHSGFGTTLFLPELYPDVPVINYFEYYFRPHAPDSDWEFRKDLEWEVPEVKYLRTRARNAVILLDLQNCDAAYAPTYYQRSVFPAEYQPKMQVVFDGVDRSVYHGHDERLRHSIPGRRRALRIAGRRIPPGTRLVTYVSRGFESMRGFDIFMRAAKRIYQEHPNTVFVVVGSDKVEYGLDRNYLPTRSFREWVLARGEFDLSKFHFVGRVSPVALGRLLAASDLHLYLTVPFILSWSMMDAMSCGAVVLGSATPPVREMIRDGHNGLLADFFDVEGLAAKAVQVLRDPAAYRPLGRQAERTIAEMYSLEAVIPQMLRMYESVANRAAVGPLTTTSSVAPRGTWTERETPDVRVPPLAQATGPGGPAAGYLAR